MFGRRSRCRGDLWMPVWNAGRKPRIGRRIGRVIAVNDSVTSGNLVNLGTRTAPAERANVRETRGLTTSKEWLQ